MKSKAYGKLSMFCLLAGLLVPGSLAKADPCGMVPPVYLGEGQPIIRVGYQQTYVFYQDGLETFIIHPGFQGKVEEFGMLIPFPAVPAIRKVSDNIFPHVAASIDPPEVVVDLRPQPKFRRFNALSTQPQASAPPPAPLALERDKVRVIKEEAIGMYEVAVLEAGSAKALKRWMDEHKYVYPKGMDTAAEEYVNKGWCFVAVKTRVGKKGNVDPQPGQREVDPSLPEGSTFDGFVQAMGFRFKVDELVVPMRLSTFNEGELHNIVYVLSDEPLKLKSIPEEYVVRQITGEELYRNVAGPLPLRVIGGTVNQIPEWQKQGLKERRDPTPHNGAAKDLFAADLLALKEDRLSHPHEEAEKMLLMIGERLQLRGQEIDSLNEESLQKERSEIVKSALEDLKSELTMTIIDGNFPREVLANQNLEFANYRMPARRNKPEFYDATKHGPMPAQPGIVTYGEVSFNELQEKPHVNPVSQNEASADQGTMTRWSVSAALSSLLIGLVWSIKRQRKVAAMLLVGLLTLSATVAFADEQPTPEKPAPENTKQPELQKLEILELIDLLDNPKMAEPAVEELVKRGEEAVPHLIGEAYEGNNMAYRGWCIDAIGEIGGKEATTRLTELQNDEKQPMLVRTWAAAARVQMAKNAEELLELANLIPQYPALGRPIGLRIIDELKKEGEDVTAETMLDVSLKVPQLQQSLAPAILAMGSEKLVTAMATAKDQNVRRQAAAYLATMAGQGEDSVAPAVVEVYKFDPKAKTLPWDGGPLFVPGLQWQKKEAQELVKNLVAWHLWCDLNNQKEQQRAIHNNLNSIQLAAAAGYQSPGFQEVGTEEWLKVYGQAYGKESLKEILEAQKAADQDRFKKLLESL